MFTDSEEEESEDEAGPPPPQKFKSKPVTSNNPPNALLPSAMLKAPSKSHSKKNREDMSCSPAPSDHAPQPTRSKPVAPPPSAPTRQSPGPLPTDYGALQERYYENYSEYSDLFTRLKLESSRLERALKMVEQGETPTAIADEESLFKLKKQYEDKHDEMTKLRIAIASARPG